MADTQCQKPLVLGGQRGGMKGAVGAFFGSVQITTLFFLVKITPKGRTKLLSIWGCSISSKHFQEPMFGSWVQQVLSLNSQS